jgi:aspartate-semialdehyde dehydrogenase
MAISVAVAGATGAVGQEMLRVLKERDFPLGSLRLLASERSRGKKLEWNGKEYTVEVLSDNSFKDVDIALFSAGATRSKQFREAVVSAGAVMIDNSSAFRMEEGVPLVVPEINPDDAYEHKGVIANPNCSTLIMVVPLFPLYKEFGIKRIHCCTYQAASGAGARAMQELKEETEAYLKGEQYTNTVIPFRYAFNLFPHNSAMQENGYCEEETKMVLETRKIFHDEDLKVNATCVRVPILRTHSEAVNVEFERETSVEEIYDVLKSAPGVEIVEEREKNRWAMPAEMSGRYPIAVGRVRKDISQDNTFDLWVVGDQLLKGAALNAVQIAELLH